MKLLYFFLFTLPICSAYGQTYNLNNSPYNMENSPYNMDNSPYNMRNSPYNMDNSPYNASSKNGVYDNTGNRIGYEVKAPSGVTNYFDNSGNRIGYTPAKKWSSLCLLPCSYQLWHQSQYCYEARLISPELLGYQGWNPLIAM